MKLGMNIRNWGPYATPENLIACARLADESDLDSIWVNDHVGLPPGDWNNEYGISNEMGSILDPLAVMAFLAAATSRISFGTAVLIVPYRPKLLTAKWIATIQVLSKGRFLMGVGPGYLTEEFRALGVARNRRGRITDETLEFLHEAFSNELVIANGQELRLSPRPARPPFLIGGNPSVAIPRAVRIGDGWMPVGLMPQDLRAHVETLNRTAAEAGREKLAVVAMKTLPLDRPHEAIELARAYRDAGATHFVHTQSYSSPDEYQAIVEQLDGDIRPAVAA